MTSQIITQGSSAADLDKLDLIADIQFNEPMTSAALNRKFFGIMPEGIYRGFNVVPAGGLTVSIGDDPVNVAVVNVDGFMLNVRGCRPIKLEVPVGREVYAIIEANYAVGRRTTQTDINASIKAADLRIINPNELRKNHVIVFSANLPVGTTEISAGQIITEKRQQSSILDDTASKLIKAMDEHIADADAHPQYAKIESPAFTGAPSSPTPPENAKGTEIATAAFVLARIAHLIGSAPDVMDTLQEISAALNNNPNFANEILLQLAGKLSKEANGSDIPDKDKFIANIGLTAIINQANNALLRTGGHLTGNVIFDNDSKIMWMRNSDAASIFFQSNSDDDPDSFMAFEMADNGNEHFRWQHRGADGKTIDEWMSLKSDGLRVRGYKVFHEGNRQTEIIATDTREILPHELVGGAFRPYFRKNTSDDGGLYMDFITLNSYVDNSGGNINAIAASKGSGRLYHHSVPFGATDWGKAYAIYSELHKPTPAELGIYSQGESDSRYYPRWESDARYYPKWESDGRYASKAELNNAMNGVRRIRRGAVSVASNEAEAPAGCFTTMVIRTQAWFRPVQMLIGNNWYNIDG